jgi:hypothetical protein
MKPRRSTPAFIYRAGIGLSGTHVTCDGMGFANDLVFLSHAHALVPREIALLASAKAGRRQIVTTEKTLRLLGDAGKKLRSRALPAAFGRPFNLGGHRIEVIPSGYLPGSAALLCETGGCRLLYIGPFCPEPLIDGIEPAEVRHADAICIDATFGDERLYFPPRAEAVAQVRAFVEESLHDGQTPVLLASPSGSLPSIAFDLEQARIPMRAHPRIALGLAGLRSLCNRLPLVTRYSGKVAHGEALLWPPEARGAAKLRMHSNLRMALVSGSAADPEVLARMRLQHGFALTNLPSYAEILAVIEATSAREVALFHGEAEPLAALLREKGKNAYAIGPPRQMTLPGSYSPPG